MAETVFERIRGLPDERFRALRKEVREYGFFPEKLMHSPETVSPEERRAVRDTLIRHGVPPECAADDGAIDSVPWIVMDETARRAGKG